jgi:hypothetical protein
MGANPIVLLDGAVGGALSGVLVGVVVGPVVESMKQASNEAIGGAIGGALSGVFLGFLIGVAAGIMVGAWLATWGRNVRQRYHMTPTRTALVGGLLSGSTVALLFGGYRWLPAGIVLGTLAAALWGWASGWADAYLASFSNCDEATPTPTSAREERRTRWELTDFASPTYTRSEASGTGIGRGGRNQVRRKEAAGSWGG